MGKWLMGALLAATAWTPMAQAQDGGWHGRHNGGQQPAAQQPAQQQQGGGWQGRNGGRGDRAAQPEAQPRAQAQVDAQAQARVQAQANGGWQGRRDWQRPQPQGDANAQAFRQQSFGARDRNRDGRPDVYARDRNGDGRPDVYARDRNGDGRPDAFARDRNGDGRPDTFARDRNGDGRFDSFARDRSGDGRPDNWNRGGRGPEVGNRSAFRNDGRSFNSGRWNNSWRHDDRYDWNRYRSYNRNAFRLPRYYAPYGWNYGYRRFSIGVVLSSVLWDQSYWIDDPYEYRLPEAYGPYRWIRYYNDALLIDERSGVVVDTVYDIFWY